jgi:hypothetical protein
LEEDEEDEDPNTGASNKGAALNLGGFVGNAASELILGGFGFYIHLDQPTCSRISAIDRPLSPGVAVQSSSLRS